MRGKAILLVVIGFVMLGSCQKKTSVPKEDFIINYNVKIANRIKEPTIIGGFFGHVMEYDGDFQPKVGGDSTTTKKPVISRSAVLIFSFDQKDKIEEAKYEENGVTFYNLKALKTKGIVPKYRYIPNKSGFYQMDLGDDQYCVLLELKGHRGYYNGGLGVLTSAATELKELEMRIDYKATF